MSLSKRRTSTLITLPPSDTNIRIRTLVSLLLGVAIILASGLSLPDIFSLRHPSPSWLVQYLTSKHTAASDYWRTATSHPNWDDYDYDNDDDDPGLTLFGHWLLRVVAAVFVLAAAHAQCSLAAHRRATPLTLRVNVTDWIFWAERTVGGWIHGLGRQNVPWVNWHLRKHWETRIRWTVGVWHPEYFWPLVLVEGAMFVALPVWEAEIGFLREGLYLGTCALLVILGNATRRTPAPEGMEVEGTEVDWEDRLFFGGLVQVLMLLLEGKIQRRRRY